jgi:hypothetical protein
VISILSLTYFSWITYIYIIFHFIFYIFSHIHTHKHIHVWSDSTRNTSTYYQIKIHTTLKHTSKHTYIHAPFTDLLSWLTCPPFSCSYLHHHIIHFTYIVTHIHRHIHIHTCIFHWPIYILIQLSNIHTDLLSWLTHPYIHTYIHASFTDLLSWLTHPYIHTYVIDVYLLMLLPARSP